MSLLAQNDKREFLRGISGGIQSSREEPIDTQLLMVGGFLLVAIILVLVALQNKYKVRSMMIRIKKKITGELIKTERYRIKRDVSIELPSNTDEVVRIRTNTTDLSRHGMFVKLNPPPPLETIVKFNLFLTEGKPSISGSAQIVWIQNGWSEHHPTGVGLKFLDLTVENENQIRLWIQKNKPKKAK